MDQLKHIQNYLHIVQCKGEGTDEVFQESMEEVHDWLDEMKQDTRNAIKELIMAYREQRDINLDVIFKIFTQNPYENVLKKHPRKFPRNCGYNFPVLAKIQIN